MRERRKSDSEWRLRCDTRDRQALDIERFFDNFNFFVKELRNRRETLEAAYKEENGRALELRAKLERAARVR